MPATAGIQVRFGSGSKTAWIPASAGMTGTRVDFQWRTSMFPKFRKRGNERGYLSLVETTEANFTKRDGEARTSQLAYNNRQYF